MASDHHRLKLAPTWQCDKKVQISKENIKVISSGTGNRRTAIVPKSPAVKRAPERKATKISIKENLRVGYGLPSNPRPIGPRKSLKLQRRAHVKKNSNENAQDDPERRTVESPISMSPTRGCLSPTQERGYIPPTPSETPSLQRYPSSIFEDYFDEPESAIDSPIHSVEALKAQLKRQSSFKGDDHDIWGRYWTEKMDVKKNKTEDRPTLQRTTTLQVAELIRNRRKNANAFRMNTMTSCLEEDENCE